MAYPITKFWFYPFCSLMIRRVRGMDNIPSKAPFIIVSNHEHLVDPLHILYPILKKLNKKVHFLSNARWWFLGDTICRQWAGCVPLFDRKQAYNESKKLIESGEIIGIFPEGGTKRTKNPKTGAVRLAIETKTAILPVGIKSSYIPFSSTVNIGKPLRLKKERVKRLAVRLMRHIYRLRNEN